MTIYSPLLTDQYQLVMAYSYWQLNMAEQEAVFHLFFRRQPFAENFTIACGLGRVIDYIQNWRFSAADLDYLRSLTTAKNTALFSEPFLNYLSELRFNGEIDALPEGSLVFPNEPLLRIKAPILQCQILETALTNHMQFSTLIATKAAQICRAAAPDPVIEFGLRRAQGPDGGLMASRAAYIGGCEAVSNVLAGQYYDIPVRGTQAHSWVMAFPDELSAFEQFAQVMPANTTLLVDTYNTRQGVKNAITVGKKLQEQGQELQAVRLDSGDLLKLSLETRKMLDDAGFTTTKILASGDLDERIITQLKAQGAAIDIWGVGTKLCTSYDHPALDMVYKLGALKNSEQQWDYKIKLSDSPGKTTTPGIQQIRRYYQQGRLLADIVYDESSDIRNADFAIPYDSYEDLLVPIFRNGKLVYQSPSTTAMREFCLQQLHIYSASNSSNYAMQLETHIEHLRKNLMLEQQAKFGEN